MRQETEARGTEVRRTEVRGTEGSATHETAGAVRLQEPNDELARAGTRMKARQFTSKADAKADATPTSENAHMGNEQGLRSIGKAQRQGTKSRQSVHASIGIGINS